MFDILETILKKKKYLIILVIVLLMASGLSYYLTVINIYQKSIKRYVATNGLWFTIISLSLSLAISFLLSAYITLFVFKRDVSKIKVAKSSAAGGFGSAAGVVATGCPSCGVPILGLFGVPLGLMAFPFKGLELKVLSIALLLLSISLISKSIKKSLTCKRVVE